MPINGYSTGKDLIVTLSDNNQGLITTTRAKQVTWKQNAKIQTTQPMDGFTRHLQIPGGWDVTMDYERTDNSLDTYIINVENKYLNTGASAPLITMQFSIAEQSGAISTYVFTGGQFTYEDAGTWKSDDYITQKVGFKFSQVNIR